MLEEEEICKRLAKVEEELELHQIRFDLLESILLDTKLRNCLFEFESKKLRERFSKLYIRCIKKVSSLLKETSLSLFASIDPSEYYFLGDSKTTQTPKFKQLVSEFNRLALTVKVDILNFDNAAAGVLAFERWIEIAILTLCDNDFNTTSALHAAFVSSPLVKYRRQLNPLAREHLEVIERVFNVNGQYMVLRNLMVGLSIPDLSIFASLVTRTVGGSPEKDPHKHKIIQEAVQATTQMREKAEELLAVSKQTSALRNCTDYLIFASKEILLKRLEELGKKLQRIPPDQDIKNFDENEVIELINQISDQRISNSSFDAEFLRANQEYEQITKGIQNKKWDTLLHFVNPLTDLWNHVNTMPNKAEEEKKHRKRLQTFLEKLTSITDLGQKIVHINIELGVSKIIASQTSQPLELIINPKASPYLKKIILALESKIIDDSAQLSVAIASQRLHEYNAKTGKNSRDSTPVGFRTTRDLDSLNPRANSSPTRAVPPLSLNKVYDRASAADLSKKERALLEANKSSSTGSMISSSPPGTLTRQGRHSPSGGGSTVLMSVLIKKTSSSSISDGGSNASSPHSISGGDLQTLDSPTLSDASSIVSSPHSSPARSPHDFFSEEDSARSGSPILSRTRLDSTSDEPLLPVSAPSAAESTSDTRQRTDSKAPHPRLALVSSLGRRKDLRESPEIREIKEALDANQSNKLEKSDKSDKSDKSEKSEDSQIRRP